MGFVSDSILLHFFSTSSEHARTMQIKIRKYVTNGLTTNYCLIAKSTKNGVDLFKTGGDLFKGHHKSDTVPLGVSS